MMYPSNTPVLCPAHLQNFSIRHATLDTSSHVQQKATLMDPAHQLKVQKNAGRLALTGLVIFNPAFNMVYVEWATKLMRSYRWLMLHQIAWTEAAWAQCEEEVELAKSNEGEVSGTGQERARPSSKEVSFKGNNMIPHGKG